MLAKEIKKDFKQHWNLSRPFSNRW